MFNQFCSQRLPGGLEHADELIQKYSVELEKENAALQLLTTSLNEEGSESAESVEVKRQIGEVKEAIQTLQEECNKQQVIAAGGSDAIREFVRTKYTSIEGQLTQLLEKHGFEGVLDESYQMIESSIESLTNDLTRLQTERLDIVSKVSKEEGSVATLTSNKTTMQSLIDELENEIKPEFAKAGVEYAPSLDAFYSFIQIISSQRALVFVTVR